MKRQFGAYILIVMAATAFIQCSIKPQPIVYGTDGCHFCSMTIVDTQHAAQMVTKKGKAFKFDAIECMINYRNEIDADDIAQYVCNHYTAPEELIDATQATFLISEGIPSPMGAYLTAFDSKTGAESAQSKHEGKLFTWDELLEHLNN
ncbi:nitrous oxide reductase accessory protein NosL [Flagellimonas pacifica]|uniref:Copper chaperone NosL n=1 Tax=Flagellimonas pacifica TaxID=1247520 RepID=A0A285MXY4_9FLAO|nr:nitrous oxide reductase accessory protein NosL [Allomuricauda parva]SNZ02042.1 copper chaperone NosL [Allomuricauda parva]